MELSVIIINHNTKELTKQTVNAVISTTRNLDYEIIVVDNSDREEEIFSCNEQRVHIYDHTENKGFGAACNLGVRRSVGEYILFLNSDTIVQNGSLKKCVDYMRKNITVGCLGIKTLLKDGSFNHGCKRGFPTPFNSLCHVLKLNKLFPKSKLFGGYTLSYLPIDKTNEVDSVSGAFMLIPRRILSRVGLFDESIFMYAEDIDLCYRIKLAGYKVIYFADTFMIHLKGQSGLHTKNTVVIKHFRDGITRFYDKYYLEKNTPLVNFCMHSAINIQYCINIIRSRLKI